MKQDVLITLRGTQQYMGEKAESIELVTRGVMTSGRSKCAISYTETALTGTEGVVSTFFISGKSRVILSRSGPIQSKMIFDEGQKNEGLYDLGFGALLITITARRVSADITEQGGSIRIDYTVDVEQSTTSHNTYEIAITPLSDSEAVPAAEESAVG